MMLSPLINGRPDTRYSCWFTAGSDGTRISSLDWTATPPSIGSAYVRSTPPTQTGALRAKPSASTAALQPQQAQTRGEIPITPAATSARNPPRFRALALFGRRPPERGESFVIPASENLHKRRHRNLCWLCLGIGHFDRQCPQGGVASSYGQVHCLSESCP
jgi:hypothetical protein